MKVLASLLAIAVGAVATLTMLVFLAAGMPNSSPQQLAEIRAYMWATAAAGGAGAVAGVWAMAKGRRKLAAWAGIAPLGFAVALFTALLAFGR